MKMKGRILYGISSLLVIDMICCVPVTVYGAEYGPERTLLEADLNKSLSSYHSFLTMNHYELSQSPSEAGSYLATVEITAESEYAEFKLNALISYRQTGQEWLMDSCEWTQLDYQVVDYPSEKQLAALLESGRAGLEAADSVIVNVAENDDGTISCVSLYETGMEGYYTQSVQIATVWMYDPEQDMWILSEMDKKYETPELSEIEGSWPLMGDEEGKITVSNAEDAEFDVDIRCGRLVTNKLHVIYDPDTGNYTGKIETGKTVYVRFAVADDNFPYNWLCVGDKERLVAFISVGI